MKKYVGYILTHFRLGCLPPNLIDSILAEYIQRKNVITLKLLKLVVSEEWRISTLTIEKSAVDKTWLPVLKGLQTTLKELKFVSCKFSNLGPIQGLKSLESLTFKDCSFSTRTLCIFSAIKGLKKLKLESCSGLDDKSGPFGYSGLEELTVLSTNISTLLMVLVPQNTLLRLEISGDAAMKLFGVPNHIFLPVLEELKFTWSSFDEKLFKIISGSCPSLKRLVIRCSGQSPNAAKINDLLADNTELVLK